MVGTVELLAGGGAALTGSVDATTHPARRIARGRRLLVWKHAAGGLLCIALAVAGLIVGARF